MRGRVSRHTRFTRKQFCIKREFSIFPRVGSTYFVGVPLIRHGSAVPPSPRGRLRATSAHRISAKCSADAEDDPKRRHSDQTGRKSLSDHLVLVTAKGVLRTVGSKSTFAYFSLTRKVGRRRQQRDRNTVGHRQKGPSPRQKAPIPA